MDWIHMILIGMVILSVCLVGYQSREFAKERKDLYDRIMAGGLETYKTNQSPNSVGKGRNPIKRSIDEAKAQYREKGGG